MSAPAWSALLRDAAARLGVRDADEKMADLVHEAVREGARR